MVAAKPGSMAQKDRTVSDDAVRLAILEHLLAGKTIKTVALDVEYHHTQVQMVASAHGWPNEKRMQWSRDLLAARIAHPGVEIPVRSTPGPAAEADTETPAPVETEQSKPPAPAPAKQVRPRKPPEIKQVAGKAVVDLRYVTAGTVPPVATNPRLSSPGSLTDLIARGRASSRESTRHVAEAFVFALRGLRAALAEDQVPVQAVQAVQEQQPVVERAATPEPAAVPEKKKRKSPTGPSAWERQGARLAPLAVSVQDVKAWGAEHGFPVKTGPILIGGLLDAYEQAHQ